MKLSLKATNPAEERIKAFLEENVSATLASKINLGTPIEKDGKRLINHKTLAGFFKYATEEARKLATKGANFACVDDNTVFGWAIHYFEEEAIEGELFNLDGTPYKAEAKTAPKAPPKAPEKKPTPEAPKAEPKKAAILTPPKAPAQPKPTEANPSQPKPTKKAKVIEHDPDQLSIFDLF